MTDPPAPTCSSLDPTSTASPDPHAVQHCRPLDAAPTCTTCRGLGWCSWPATDERGIFTTHTKACPHGCRDTRTKAEAGLERASIVAFLTAETKRFKEAADAEASKGNGDTAARLYGKASILRTLAAQIQRGDDKVTP
jgi:hypothetical protein